MKRALLGLALAAILPVSAQAADDTATSAVSYNYIEGVYTNADVLGENIDGFGIAGSVAFNHDWYGSAQYRKFDKNGVSFDQGFVNIGWRHAVSEKADFLAEVGYANFGVDAGPGFDDSADGWRAAVGLRGMMAPKLEGRVKATWTKINDFGNNGEFGAEVGATWNFNDTWGLTGSYEHVKILDEGVNIWGLGVRASF